MALCLTILIVLPAVSSAANNLQKSFDDLSQSVGRSRGLALAILQQLKDHDAIYRDRAGRPIETQIAQGRAALSPTAGLVASFEGNSTEVEKGLIGFKKEVASKKASPELVSKLQPKAVALEADYNKYKGYVERFYERAVSDFGKPGESMQQLAALPQGQKLAVNGEANLLLGASSYKRPNTNPLFKSSSTDLGFGADARYVPEDKTNIALSVSHKKTVEIRKISLTDVALTGTHNFTSNLAVGTGVDFSGFSDAEIKELGYSDKGAFVSGLWNGAGMNANSKLRWSGRHYGKIDGADYGVMTWNNDVKLPAGPGNVGFKLNYLKQSFDVSEADHTDFNPAVVWQFSSGGSSVEGDYRKISYPNVEGCPFESRRIKGGLMMKSSSGSKSKSWGPQVVMYDYPNADLNNFTDFKLVSRSMGRDEKYFVQATFDVTYRSYSDTSQFDFVQFEWRMDRNPFSTGRYSKWNVAARGYTGSVDKNNYLNVYNIHPPHSVDFYWSFGWTKGNMAWLKALTVGPIVGGRLLVDTERDKFFKNDLSGVDYVFRNPENNVRGGMEASARMGFGTGIVWSATFSYIHAFLYNAKPVRTSSIARFEAKASYPLQSNFVIDGYTNLHSTKADLSSASDLQKTDFGIKLRYLFDTNQ